MYLSSNLIVQIVPLLLASLAQGQDASAAISFLRGGDTAHRRLRPASTFCHENAPGDFITVTTNYWSANFIHGIMHQELEGSCASQCEILCADYASFEVDGDKCLCKEVRVVETSVRSSSSGGDTDPTASSSGGDTDPTALTSEGDTDPTASSIEGECNNQYGNPCGPGSACTDTEPGFHTCSQVGEDNVCAFGCPPTEDCVLGECTCKEGFERTNQYLPCNE
jgi:hypothetical protein